MGTTYYDPRAARTAAAAEAETRRAEAEAMRAETALRMEAARMEMAARQADQADRARAERERSRTARREQRRARRAEARAARRAALRHGAGALTAAVVQRVPLLVGGVAMGAPIVIAWEGQIQFARQTMHLGAMAPALPIALEGAAWYLAWLVHRALAQHMPTAKLRTWTWVLAFLAAAMNFWHGAAAYSVQVGVVRALASLLGIGLWELTVSARRVSTSGRGLAELRTALWRRVRYPRLSWQAASIQAARGAECSIEEAWEAAWIDRYGVGPDASRRDRRLARSIVRHQSRADRKAARSGELSIVDGSIVGRPSIESAPSIEAERIDSPAPSIEANPGRSIEPRSIDRPFPAASIEAAHPADAPETADAPSIDVRPIQPPARSIEARSIEVVSPPAPVGRSIPREPRRSIEAAPVRRSIDEHRAALAAAIEAGTIENQPSAESIRKTLRCSPSTARQLRDELAGGASS